jgi:hypothetical protein
MLSYLGGEIEIIHIFKLKINSWKQSQTNNIIFIHQNILFEQPFQQIQLTFYCNSKSILVEWILYKHKKIQLNSPCPTQIQIQSGNHPLQLDYRNNDLSKIEMDHEDNHSIIRNKHLIDNSDKTHYRIYATKVCAIFNKLIKIFIYNVENIILTTFLIFVLNQSNKSIKLIFSISKPYDVFVSIELSEWYRTTKNIILSSYFQLYIFSFQTTRSRFW